MPNHTLVNDEARHFIFRVLVDTEKYEYMHDILLSKGMCSESRGLFKFWIMSIFDNMSERVLDKDIVATED